MLTDHDVANGLHSNNALINKISSVMGLASPLIDVAVTVLEWFLIRSSPSGIFGTRADPFLPSTMIGSEQQLEQETLELIISNPLLSKLASLSLPDITPPRESRFGRDCFTKAEQDQIRELEAQLLQHDRVLAEMRTKKAELDQIRELRAQILQHDPD